MTPEPRLQSSAGHFWLCAGLTLTYPRTALDALNLLPVALLCSSSSPFLQNLHHQPQSPYPSTTHLVTRPFCRWFLISYSLVFFVQIDFKLLSRRSHVTFHLCDEQALDLGGRWKRFRGLYKELRFLPYLQTSKLACHCFMDTGRRHKTPESETKNSSLLIATLVSRASTFSSFPGILLLRG